MTGEQIRAARALAGWTAADLAQKSGVSYPTVQRLDSTRGVLGGRHETIEAIRAAFVSEGIQFLAAGSTANGAGVAMIGERSE